VAGYEVRAAVHQDAWAVLDSFYIPTRYPNGLPGDIPARVYNRQSADAALLQAEQVVGAVAGWMAEVGDGAVGDGAVGGATEPASGPG
jgi:HEPN domain-containing protein